MMRISVPGAYAHVTGDPEEIAWAAAYMTFRNPNAFFSGAPPTYTLLKKDGRFPAGLVVKMAQRAKEDGFEVELIDSRPSPVPYTVPEETWLRDYQLAAFRAAESQRCGILQMPTGSGKTEVFAALAAYSEVPWLFLAHREILVRQAAERLERRTGIQAGLLVSGSHNWGGERVVCATFQSFLAMKGWEQTLLVKDKQGLVVDEAHTVPAKTFFNAVMSVPAHTRIGLSATPLQRDDQRSVMAVAALGPVIYRLRPEVLIERGVLARPQIKMARLDQTCDRPTWQGVYGEAIVRSAARNRLVVDLAKKAERPFLVFVKEVGHGKELTRMLAKAGLNVEFVWGQHSNRERAIKDLERAALDGIVCSVVFQEGVDIPCLRAVVIASGGKSAIAAVQRVGRGSRVEDGKSEFQVWDVMDGGNRLLLRHAKKRKDAYEEQGYTVEVVDA